MRKYNPDVLVHTEVAAGLPGMGNFGHSHRMCTLYIYQYSTGKANIYGIMSICKLSSMVSICLDYVRFYSEACKYTVVTYASVDNVISWKVIPEK